MNLFIDDNAPVIVQGATGSVGLKHTARMLAAGTNIVGGTNPRKAGTTLNLEVHNSIINLPIFGTVEEAKTITHAQASVIFVPPRFAKDAILEAIDAKIPLIVVITEGIPIADSAICVAAAQKTGVRLIGPNCPGLVTFSADPHKTGINLGIIPDGITQWGPLALVSKSGTLTYQLMDELSDIGFTQALGIGGDPIVGTTLRDALEVFEEDNDTKACVMIGEIGGSAEQEAAQWAKQHMTKPIFAYIAGFTAPPGKQMGHAGAIISGGKGTAQEKKKTLEDLGIPVGLTPGQTAALVRNTIKNI